MVKPMDQNEKPVKAETQMRTWLAAGLAGLFMAAVGWGGPLGQMGLLVVAISVVGALWLLASARDRRP